MSDFLKKVDQKLKTQATEQTQRVEREESEAKTAEAFVRAVVPILQEYKEMMLMRSVGVELTNGREHFQFTMRYGNGKQHGFSFGRRREGDGYVVLGLHTDERTGRQYTAEGIVEGGPAGWAAQGVSWSANEFRKYIERQILEFLDRGDKNGGFKEPE